MSGLGGRAGVAAGVDAARSWRMRPSSRTSTRSASFERLVDVVGDEQDGRPVPAPQLEHQLVHLDAGQGVEGAERLVEQQQVGVADQGPGQRDALGLAAGERQRPGVVLVGEPDLVERRAGPLDALAPLRGC